MILKNNNWYHLSHTWVDPIVSVSPRGGRIDDISNPLDRKPSICVCPSILECLIAIGEWDFSEIKIYKTIGEPSPADWVFDYHLTSEHRFYEPMDFHLMGSIDIKKLNSISPKVIVSGKPDKVILNNLSIRKKWLQDNYSIIFR